jgi:hypothetical protein
VTGTPTLTDKAKPVMESAVRPEDNDVWPPPERHGPSIYADYWRERSGFFTETPKVDGKAPHAGKAH